MVRTNTDLHGGRGVRQAAVHLDAKVYLEDIPDLEPLTPRHWSEMGCDVPNAQVDRETETTTVCLDPLVDECGQVQKVNPGFCVFDGLVVSNFS